MKIYIAKSNKANPEYLLKIRNFLSNFKSVEILEYNGGKYDNTDLISADMLIVIPDLSEGINNDRIVLGKGLYMQIDDFISNQGNDGVFIITGIDKDGEVQYSYIDEVDCDGDYDDDFMTILNENNFIKYGDVRVSDSRILLTKQIAEFILVDDDAANHYKDGEINILWDKYVTRITTITNRYKYLLIKK